MITRLQLHLLQFLSQTRSCSPPTWWRSALAHRRVLRVDRHVHAERADEDRRVHAERAFQPKHAKEKTYAHAYVAVAIVSGDFAT